MADNDPLLLLRAAIISRKPIKFLTGEGQETASLSSASTLALPMPSSTLNLPKSTPTRLRKPNHTETDPSTHPASFISLDAVYLAWSLKEAQSAEYMKVVRESGVGITGMVAITEKASVVDWLEGRVDAHPNIVPLPGQAGDAVQLAGQKRRYVPDSADIDAVKRIKLNEIELLDRNTILRGSKQTNFSSVRKLVEERMKKLREVQAAAASTSVSAATTTSKVEPKSPSKRPHRVNPIIMISSSPTSLITLQNVRAFLEQSTFVDPQVAKAQSAADATLREDVVVVYRKRTHIEPSGRETETQTKYFVVDGIEALNKFGSEAWERVVCVLTTGQAWQFKPYKWSEPRELFTRVKGFYVCWANDPSNARVRDWNVTELKIDPNKRHLDKSTVAQFWKTLDQWVQVNKPNLLY